MQACAVTLQADGADHANACSSAFDRWVDQCKRAPTDQRVVAERGQEDRRPGFTRVPDSQEAGILLAAADVGTSQLCANLDEARRYAGVLAPAAGRTSLAQVAWGALTCQCTRATSWRAGSIDAIIRHARLPAAVSATSVATSAHTYLARWAIGGRTTTAAHLIARAVNGGKATRSTPLADEHGTILDRARRIEGVEVAGIIVEPGWVGRAGDAGVVHAERPVVRTVVGLIGIRAANDPSFAFDAGRR